MFVLLLVLLSSAVVIQREDRSLLPGAYNLYSDMGGYGERGEEWMWLHGEE